MTGRRLSFALALLLLASLRVHAAPALNVIVKLNSPAALSLVSNILQGTLLDSIPEANTYLLRVPYLPLVLPSILRLVGLEWMEVEKEISLPGTAAAGILRPPDGAVWDWYKDQPAMRLIRADLAHAHATGRGILVADINTRVDYAHPALAGHLTAGADFVGQGSTSFLNLNDDQSTAGFLDDDQSTADFLDDDQSTAGFLDGLGVRLALPFLGSAGGGASSHGTFCAGILAAVAPEATIMPIRAFDDQGNGDLFTIAKAIRYARQRGVQVINMSFGTLADSNILREAIASARAANIVLVASAGNNNTAAPQYPAAYPGVIAAAATDLLDRKAEFSNYGSYVFVVAPGVHIISAAPSGRYTIANGTSFSAPMVAGMAAMVRSVRYAETAAAISEATVAVDSRNPQYVGKLGYGRIDVLKAVRP